MARKFMPVKLKQRQKVRGTNWLFNTLLKTRVHNSIDSRSLLFAKDMIFWKQKFDVKQLEGEQFYV